MAKNSVLLFRSFGLRGGGASSALVFAALVGSAAFSGCGLSTQGSDYSGASASASSSGSSSGSSSSGSVTCEPGATAPCYTGPMGTEGVGLCAAGVATCDSSGMAFGPCEGEVLPIKEDCSTSDVDDDCDGTSPGVADNDCLCAPSSTSDCATDLLGACKAGLQTCEASGTAYGACEPKLKPSFDNCTTAEDEDCDGVAPGCTGTPLAAFASGVVAKDVVGISVATDSKGNAVIGGVKGKSFWLIKLDPSGAVVWEKAIAASGGGADAAVNGVAIDKDDSIVAVGGFVGTLDIGGGAMNAGMGLDMFVARFAPDGVLAWSKSFGDGPASTALHRAHAVALDAVGNALVTGTFSGLTNFGAFSVPGNDDDLFVMKVDLKGTPLWAMRAGDAETQIGDAIAVDANNDVFVAGRSYGAMDFAGFPIAGAAGLDSFLVKLSGADGTPAWTRAITDVVVADATDQEARDMTVDSAGDVLLMGRFRKAIDLKGATIANMDATGMTSDIFLAKYDTSGTLKWAKSFGDAAGTQGGDAVTVDGADNIVVGGYLRSPFSLGGDTLTLAEPAGSNYDFWIGKLDKDGAHLWSSRFGDVGNEYITSIRTDGQGNVVATGDFSDSITLPVAGVGPLTSVGNYDAFFLKLSP